MKIYTKHYRDGVELPELNRDNHYSPHFQEIRRLHRVVRLMPVRTKHEIFSSSFSRFNQTFSKGDEIVNTCVDQTSERKNVTLVNILPFTKFYVDQWHH